MKLRVLVICLMLASPAGAETFPALYSVTGVAGDDVLNIRLEPDATAEAVGSLPPDATNIEVVGLSPDGGWGQIIAGEAAGWIKMEFLARSDAPDWFALQMPLTCLGNEPFWSLKIDAPTYTATYTTPEVPELRLSTLDSWPGTEFRPIAAIRLGGDGPQGFATVRGELCSDGMSDRIYGLSADLFLGALDGGGGIGPALSGCCMIAPLAE